MQAVSYVHVGVYRSAVLDYEDHPQAHYIVTD